MGWIRYGAAIVSSLASASAPAQEAIVPGWTVEAGIYGWLMATEGTLGIGGTDVEVDNSFADTLEQSDSLLAFMGRVEAWRGDAGLFLDGAFVKLGYDDIAAGAAE
ncbi:MAG TPA: hypothetical protein VFO41_03360, partial [Alphaproteobacteria bacterium]|nr:hypothetical protein [Alphaproteobacteria bacterium]